MVVRLNDDWRIVSDSLQWSLERCRVPAVGPRQGERVWAAISWHPSLESAALAASERRVRDIDSHEHSCTIAAIERLRDEVRAWAVEHE